MADVHDDLARLLSEPGPFATVYLTTEGAVAQPQDALDLRWKNLRKELAEQGAPESALESIDPLIDRAYAEGGTLVVVATAEGVRLEAHPPDPPQRDLVRWAPLPYIAPVVEWRQSMPPHVVVLTDRRGADIHAFFREAPQQVFEAGGGEDPIHKAKPGGWSQRRFQQRAENVWEHNAKEVADALTRVVDAAGARLVVAAGDVRAIQLLEEHAPDRVSDLMTVIDGQRAVDGGTDEVAEEVVKLVASAVAEDTVATLEKFREERGQDDRAADGPRATVDALNRAQVGTLLVHDDPDDDRRAWFGPDPVPVGLARDDLAGLGVDTPQEGRLVDVLLRAGLGTGASVRMIPSTGPNGPAEGVGAILRY